MYLVDSDPSGTALSPCRVRPERQEHFPSLSIQMITNNTYKHGELFGRDHFPTAHRSSMKTHTMLPQSMIHPGAFSFSNGIASF